MGIFGGRSKWMLTGEASPSSWWLPKGCSDMRPGPGIHSEVVFERENMIRLQILLLCFLQIDQLHQTTAERNLFDGAKSESLFYKVQ